MTDTIYLAIETSTPTGSVAVGTPANLLSEAVLGVHARHSTALLPAIDFVLQNARVAKAQVTRIVVGGGPGSFTGLRISAATAKALARALDVPLFAYSGLAALAAGVAMDERQICALFDARRGEVYSGCYRFPELSRMETVLEPAPRRLDDVLAAIDVASTVFVGDGAVALASAIRERGGVIAPAHLGVPRASALGWLSEITPTAGRVDDIARWEPLYLRESGAERMRSR